MSTALLHTQGGNSNACNVKLWEISTVAVLGYELVNKILYKLQLPCLYYSFHSVQPPRTSWLSGSKSFSYSVLTCCVLFLKGSKNSLVNTITLHLSPTSDNLCDLNSSSLCIYMQLQVFLKLNQLCKMLNTGKK